MRTVLAMALLCAFDLLARSSSAANSPALTLAPGGGLGGLAVSVDVAHKSIRYASCRDACAVTDASPSLVIDGAGHEVDAARAVLTEISLAGGRRLAHVKVPLVTTAEPEALAWEALFVAGSAPLFAGVTGYSRGEPGERAGTDVRFLPGEGHATVVIGEIREDLRLCGDDATLLDPRGLDPATLLFHGATLQRLSPSRRESAVAIAATAHVGPREPALAPLLRATVASSELPRAPAAALTDGDPTTAWSEARPGRGQGEFVLLQSSFDVPLVRFNIAPLPPTPSAASAAPETFYLATNTETYEVTLPEDAAAHPGGSYDVALPEPLKTSCVALVLADAFTHGRPHPEVSVAELTAYSAFDHAGAALADLASALRGGDAKAVAAAGILERAGASGVAAASAAYASLDAPGRSLALGVAASAPSCEASGSLFASALGDADAIVRAKALAKLQQPGCGREALPALLVALKWPATRAKVAPLVALLGHERALPALAAVLGEGTPEERHAVRSAVTLAAREASPEALLAVLEAAKPKLSDARLDTLRALSDRIADIPAAIAASAKELLAHSSAADRYLLVPVLARLAATDATGRALLTDLALRDSEAEVRTEAVASLAGTSLADTILPVAARDGSPRVREAALRAVAAGEGAVPTSALIHLLVEDPWTFVRVASAAALARLPADEGVERAFAEALLQKSPRVREQAVLALGAHRALRQSDAVRERMTDPKEDSTVRLAAARTAGLLCDVEATDTLAAFAVRGASSLNADQVALGLVATDALGAIHPKNLAALFAPLQAKDARPDARAAAARALAATSPCR